jgi:L,D-transpeptidase catalytic domain/Bacterial SH3 domain
MRRCLALALPSLSIVGWLMLGAGPAAASRFGPPWMSRVIADQALVYQQPDPAAAVVGPLAHGAILVVLGQQRDDANREWTQTTLGYVPSEAVTEFIDAWVADVTVPSTPVYAKPNARDVVRMNANEGELMRVTGVSHGMNGDPNLWWSTTEGYVALDALQPSQNPWSTMWTVPDGLLALNAWWGATRTDANVRAGPTADAPSVGHLPAGDLVKVLVEGPGQDVQGSSTWYRIDGGRYAGGWVHSSLIQRAAQPQANTTPPPAGSASGRWVVVDRRHHSLTLVDHGEPAFVTYVALGVAGRETPTGTYSTWGKYRADDMTSASVKNPGGYYDLPNVPDTQYYLDGGFAIHGTYWHDDFGSDESHGCVNITWTDGRYLFSQTLPFVGDGQLTTPTGQPATEVVILS